MHPSGALTIVALIALSTTATISNETCYNIDGSVSTVSYRCSNETTGHTTCCQPGAVCYSNGVCQTINEGVEDYQRVGCTDRTWQDSACLDECGQYAPDSTAGIRPCDGITKGNHYCCDTGAEGVGSYACCDNSTDIFVLGSSIPTVLAQMPLSQTSTSTTASATGTSTSTPTATGGSKSTKAKAGNDETAVGLGVGLGVGVPLAVAVGGLVWFLTWRSRRKEHLRRGAAIESSYGGAAGQPYGGYAAAPPASHMTSIQRDSDVSQQRQQQQQLYQAGPTPAYDLPKHGVSLHEMQSPMLPVELPSTPMHELP